MHDWITIWKWIYLLGLLSYALLVIVIIPLGARDLSRMFMSLRRGETRDINKVRSDHS